MSNSNSTPPAAASPMFSLRVSRRGTVNLKWPAPAPAAAEGYPVPGTTRRKRREVHVAVTDPPGNEALALGRTDREDSEKSATGISIRGVEMKTVITRR